MKNLSAVWLFIFSTFVPLSAFAEKINISLGVYTEHLEAFQSVLSSGQCPDPRNYLVSDNQILTEFLILCEAIKLGGLEPKIEFKAFPVYVRLLRELDGSSIAALAFGGWRRDLDISRFYISPPIIPPNTFTKGFFVKPENQHALMANSREQLASLTAVTSAGWKVDVESISCVGSKMISARTYVNMFRMVGAGRADYLITTFPAGDDLNVDFYGVKLRPIHGVKIVFKDSLHFAVSKSHPDGAKIFAALELGMQQLIADGTIDYVLAKLGIINHNVTSWKDIGCIK
ncbi:MULTISPECIES: hypothetical protein [unclassified Cellvibrio]|uniref:hypothetical protein n=1 Tax=unclassified Cellvibrio TaxID=2624793 RepID=UPI0007808874|nr:MULTISPECIES: hypothetical protein [unclassified Cellvibrio]QEY16996.1 hypothetical protein D0C16_14040 [Cellvibrio sp. KY-GH-1]